MGGLLIGSVLEYHRHTHTHREREGDDRERKSSFYKSQTAGLLYHNKEKKKKN